jgi:hypothetical protein
MPGVIAAAAKNASLLAEETKKNVPITQSVLDQNSQMSSAVGQQVQQQSQFQQQTDQINSLRDMASSFTSGSLGDIANEFSNSTSRQDILSQLDRGQQDAFYTGHISLNQARMEAAERQISGLASKSLINYGIGTVTKGLFGTGQPGSNGYQPGLFGGLASGLGGMFGLGGTYQGGAPDFSSGIGLFHSGGIVGGLAPASRFVDMSIFAGAPRFGGGGIVDGEVPVVAHKGEGIFTPAQMKAMGGGGATVHNYNMGGSQVVVQGSVDEKTMPMIQAAIAQNNTALTKQITRNLGTIQSKSAQLYQ